MMAYCVGLTGNIASGKSTIAGLFAKLGVDVISADHIARELTTKNQVVINQIIAHFGSEVVLPSGELDRKCLRSLIFSNPQDKKWLEDLLHPLVRLGIEQQISHSQSPYCLIEIPLLINKQFYPYLNRILVVTSPIGLQITRVMQRDQCTKVEALAVISKQVSLDAHLKGADDVLSNDADLESLRQKVEMLHSSYLREASYHSQ